MKQIPVTILTGYLGAGKTTVLNEVLKQTDINEIAVVVNDIGSVNIDAKLVSNNNAFEVDRQLVELENGCICCSLRDEFLTQIKELSQHNGVERILVEASGVSNPAAIAEGFLAYYEITENPTFYLDAVITVVDAYRMKTEFSSGGADPDIMNLVSDQIEFCNTVLLNKCDMLNENEIADVEDLIRTIQLRAEIVRITNGNVNVKEVFEGTSFNYEDTLHSSALQEALKRDKNSELDDCGIQSFVIEGKEPFDYDRFMNFLENEYPSEIIRAKGYLWFSEDDMHVQLFEQVGRNASVTVTSNWVASFEEKDKQDFIRQYPEVLDEWDEQFGDRFHQIVFIGKNFNEEEVRRKLETCFAR